MPEFIPAFWRCNECRKKHDWVFEAMRCEEACKQERVEEALADGVSLHEVEDQLDDEENTGDTRPVTSGCNVTQYPADEPKVEPLACVVDTIEKMLDALAYGPQFETVRHAVRAGKHAIGICNALLKLDATEPSRINSDFIRALNSVESAMDGDKKARAM